MQIHNFTLKNGLRITFTERKGTDVVAMALVGKSGSIFEEVPGTAHFLEHLNVDSTEKYSNKGELHSLISSSGGVLGAGTSKDFSQFYVKIMSSEIESGFDFLSQVVFHPLLSNQDIEKEKKVILHEIKRAQADNQRQLHEAFLGLSYSSEVMQRMVLGTEESLQNINEDVLKSFWSKYYIPNNFVLSISGDLQEDVVFALAEKYFAELKAGEQIVIPPLEKETGQNIKVLKRDNAFQAKIMFGYQAPSRDSEDYYKCFLMSAILGRGTLSRLLKSIREEKQLVYDISSWYSYGLNRSLFYVQAGIDEKNINEVLESISNEFKKIAETPPSSEELDYSKKRIKSAYVFGFEDSLQLVLESAELLHLLKEESNFEEEFRKVEHLTGEDVLFMAKKIFAEKPNLAVLAKEITENQIKIPSFGL